MGSIFKPKTSTPPVPPSPPPATYMDEIGGTQQIPVKNADGSYTYITKRLPLTPEQEAEEAEYKSIMQDALDEIQKLSSSDYNEDEGTQAILNAWETEKSKYLDESFTDRATEEDKILARRGLASSSAGEAAKRRRVTDMQEAHKELDREKDLLASDIRNEKLALQQNLYNIAASRSDIESARTLSSASSGMSAVSSINNSNRASIADYYSRQMNNYNSRVQNTSGLFGQAVNGIYNTVSNPVGSILGSIF